MSTAMRAKFLVTGVTPYKDGEGNTLQETLSFTAVAKSTPYPEDGSDEDNTFAKFSPSADCRITVANPALFGQFEVGKKYYVDFTPVPEA